jgi:KinB signaling pathway activation protein
MDDVGRLLRVYLRLLAALMALSCLGLLFLPMELGSRTPWGVAPGWQREIALWNLSIYIVIVWTLRRTDAVSARGLVTGLVVLNFLVVANHFATVMGEAGAFLNAIAGAVNIGSGTLGLIALWRERAGEGGVWNGT